MVQGQWLSVLRLNVVLQGVFVVSLCFFAFLSGRGLFRNSFMYICLWHFMATQIVVDHSPSALAPCCISQDEWTLRDCCGAAALRETSSVSDTGPSVWSVGHEKRIHDFLEQVMDKEIAGRPVVLHHQEPKVLERFQRVSWTARAMQHELVGSPVVEQI